MTGILLILTLQASDARDTSYVEVTAEGVAALGASADIARDNAIKDALRKAVEQGVGAYIDSKTAVDNYELLYDKIYSHAQGYVASYEVVKEKADKDAGLYRVWIKAKVKAGIIQNDLVAMGILVSEMGRPRLAVVVDNEDLAYTLEDYFQEQGFPLVDLPTVKKVLKADELDLLIDGDKRTAQKVATLTGAEILITGRAEVSSEMKKLPYTDEKKTIYTAKLRVKAVEALTGEVIAVSSLKRSLPFSEEEVIKLVGDSSAKELSSEILKKWTLRRNVIHIIIKGATAAKIGKIKTGIRENIRGVSEVLDRGMVEGYAIIEVVAETNPQEVLDAIREKEKILGIQVVAYEGQRIEAKAK